MSTEVQNIILDMVKRCIMDLNIFKLQIKQTIHILCSNKLHIIRRILLDGRIGYILHALCSELKYYT